MGTKKQTFVLEDMGDNIPEGSDRLTVTVEASTDGIFITAAGYGDNTSKDGKGVPIMLELYNGEFRVVVWDNINEEDASHVISLKGAKESSRITKYKCPKCGAKWEDRGTTNASDCPDCGLADVSPQD